MPRRRISPSEIRQAQRFTVPADAFSEQDQERRLELAQDGREDAEREAAEVEAEQSYESEEQ